MSEQLTDRDVKRLIGTVEEGFNKRDIHLIESVLGPNLIDHSEAFGRVDLRQRLARVLEAMPDASYHVEEYILEGPAVAWRWSIRGHHERDEILRHQATGRELELRGLSMAVLKDGRAVEHWEFPDYDSLAEQLDAAS
jgi:predicted ester cyclase